MSSAAKGLVPLLGLLPLAALGCMNGASSETGTSAWLRLGNAQFVPGEISQEHLADAPTIVGITAPNSIVSPGATGRSIGGSANAATSVLIGLEGDTGHWILPTGAPDPDTAGAFQFSAPMSFSLLMPLTPNMRNMVFRAVDATSSVGPPLVLAVKVAALSAAGNPPLIVTLQWDANADLDLKVRIPNVADPTMPIDIWTRSRIGLPPLPAGQSKRTPDEVAAAGQFDFDSNAACVIDGKNTEDVTFNMAPPPGDYQVRVDAFSMCGQPAARWHAYAIANGTTIAEAFGQMGDLDTQITHGPETGTLAFSFTVP
jgi:hypothetical protein